MKKPLIGLVSYELDDRGRYALPAEYSRAVYRAGGLPAMLPPVSAGELAADWLGYIDGLVLTGGGDINPELYGGKSHPLVYHLDAERDGAEAGLIKALAAQAKPTLAICRGMQMVNVVLGGTLYPHLPDVYGEKVAHRMPPRYPTMHDVEVDPGSRLAELMGTHQVHTVSWHHQALNALAPGFKVVGRAADGVVEAIENPAYPWLVGVEWHPEMSAERDPSQQRLFDWLVREARRAAP